MFWPNSAWWYIIFVLRQRIFASTYKAIYESKNVCVRKLHPTLDKEHVAAFSKEADIIQRINNRHVVKLIAVSDNPITIMMEFCAFSFTLFNQNATVNSLDDFFSYYDQEDLHCFFPTILHKISSDTTKAVQYIHSDSIVHWDIKPTSILVNNMHYNNMTDVQETANIFKSQTIICKLADLGEARSKLLQTRVFSNNSRTHFLRRDSPAYMAPKILVEESIPKSAGTIESHRCVGTCHDFFHQFWPEKSLSIWSWKEKSNRRWFNHFRCVTLFSEKRQCHLLARARMLKSLARSMKKSKLYVTLN